MWGLHDVKRIVVDVLGLLFQLLDDPGRGPPHLPQGRSLPRLSEPGGYTDPRFPKHLGLEYPAVGAGEAYLGDLPGHVRFPELREGGAVAVLVSEVLAVGRDEKEHVP